MKKLAAAALFGTSEGSARRGDQSIDRARGECRVGSRVRHHPTGRAPTRHRPRPPQRGGPPPGLVRGRRPDECDHPPRRTDRDRRSILPAAAVRPGPGQSRPAAEAGPDLRRRTRRRIRAPDHRVRPAGPAIGQLTGPSYAAGLPGALPGQELLAELAWASASRC